MQKAYDPPVLDKDPFKILGVTDDSGEEEIRSAYLKKIKEYPPDSPLMNSSVSGMPMRC